MIEIILKAIWYILPAYIANSFPTLLSKIDILHKYNSPIDFNKKVRGNEIFGKGKTWFGLVFGIYSGTFFGLIQSLTNIEPFMSLKLAFTLSLGALIGDMIGSFIKRRINLKRGTSLPGVDQLDFILGAFLFAALIGKFNLTYFIILLIITPIIHLMSNKIGYKIGVKKEPW